MQRRGFLKCMTWAGTAMVWTVAGGVPRSRLIGSAEAAANEGFTLRADQRQPYRLRQAGQSQRDRDACRTALSKIAAMPTQPAFMIHTGDITHLSKPAQFDTVQQLHGQRRSSTLHTVPGEHDILEEEGKSYLNRFGKGTKGDGWYSFDANGVHFIGLVNVVEPAGQRARHPRPRAARVAGSRREAAHRQHADRGVRACAAVGGLCRLGLGHVGRRAGAELPEEVRLGHRAERPHPPDDAEGGGQRRVPHGVLDRVSAAGAGHAPRGRGRCWCRRRS